MISEYKLSKSNIENIMSLTTMQQGMLFHYINDVNSKEYHEQLSLTIRGDLKLDVLKKSWKYVIDSNEMLRTIFRWTNIENPIQVVLKDYEVPIKYIDFTNEMDKNKAIESIKLNDLDNRIDIAKETLRIYLCKLDKNTYNMIISNHHILYDGWSNGIILKELMGIYSCIYKGKDIKKINKTKFDKFIKHLNGVNKENEKEYWTSYLDNIENKNDCFMCKEVGIHKKISYKIESNKANKIKDFSKANKVLLSSVLYGAWGVLLQKLNNSNEVLFGTIVSGRPENISLVDQMVGLFINAIPLKAKANNKTTLLELICDINKNLDKRKGFENTPLIDIKEYCGLKIDEEMFNSIVTIENYPLGLKANKENILKIEDFSIIEQTNFNMALDILTFDDIEFKFNFNSLAIDEGIVKNLGNYLEKIIENLLNNPNINVEEIDLLSEKERNQILYEFNDTKVDYPKDKTIHELFEAQVEKTPDNIAVVFEDKKLTYRELNERANILARVLRDKGVKADSIVGIMVERSFEMIMGIIGILKAGGAYLPIDSNYPKERIEYMLKDSESKLLLSKNDLVENIEFDGEIIDLYNENLFNKESSNLEKINNSFDLAYIIYTSGTTGKPKGVMIEHRSLVNRLNWMQKKYPISAKDTILQKTTYTFDVSVWEILWWSLVGARVCMLSPNGEKDPMKIIETIDKYKVTTMHFVPSMLDVFLYCVEENRKNINLSSLVQVFSSGEALNFKQVSKFYKEFESSKKLINLYGPTEVTIDVSYFDCDNDGKRVIPIGKPIDNTKLYILKNNELVPIGVVGELCISGDGLSRGYTNRLELTAEKFVDNPFEPGTKMYKTGDLARWLPDGNIEFLGRIDNQVKIRGFRIELGEIESRLLQHENIKEAAVLVKGDKENEKYICAYVVSEKKLEELDLRGHLKETLPEYMVPAYFVELEKMPLTTNGKLDRRVLPEPNLDKILTEYEAPRNEVEETLAKIWSEILGVEKVGVNDNFFDLGGHSLKAIMLISKIHKELNKEVPLKELFKLPTIKDLSKYIESTEENIYSKIEKVEEKEYYEASSAQKRMYMLQQFDKDSIAYNMPGAIEIDGRIEIDKINDTFLTLIERHETLRTSFDADGEYIIQKIHQTKDIEFKIQEITANSELEVKDKINDFVRTFDLTKAPLLRVGIIKLNNERHILLYDMHHIISDGVSMGILIKEFGEIYGGKQKETLKLQYKDYAVWQKKMQKTEAFKLQEEYWLNEFKGEIPVLSMPTDYIRPQVQSFKGDELDFAIGKEHTNKLREIAKETATTMNMVLLSVFNILLSKYSGQEDIVVGTSITGRPHLDLQDIIGMFVNTLVIRSNVTSEKSYNNYLYEMKQKCLSAYENQNYQFEVLVQKLNLKRETNRNPVFDVMFEMQNMDISWEDMNKLNFSEFSMKTNVAKFDMAMSVIEKKDCLCLNINYSTDLYKKETVGRIKNHYLNIIEKVIENIDIKIKDIEILGGVECRELLIDFNNNKEKLPKNETIQKLFEEQVEKTPNRIAVLCNGVELTYEELNHKANKLARVLRRNGIKQDCIVGIAMERSIEMIIGIIATFKAGGAYIPIDVEYPKDRIKYMLENSNAQVLLTSRKYIFKDDEYEKIVEHVLEMENEQIDKELDSNLEHISNEENLAYIIYTSGSTGKPKGAMVEHLGMLNHAMAKIKDINLSEESVVSQNSSHCFDISVWQFLASLIVGGKVVIYAKEKVVNVKEFINEIENDKVTVLEVVPTYLGAMLDNLEEEHKELNNLKNLLITGEALSKNLVQRWFNSFKNVKLVNAYGPTEASDDITHYIMDRVCDYDLVPIGKPIQNLNIYIVNKDMNLCPIGVVGELCVSGIGVGRGYINNSEKTQEVFMSDPFIKEEGVRLYKTGDLARWLPDGNIEFLGRKDYQVKIRGFRIELGEIENELLKHEKIKEAVVVDKAYNNGTKFICAYIVALEAINVSEIRNYLKQTLPEYMVPSYFIQIDKLPLNANGKVDRKMLPELSEGVETSSEYEAPRDEVEKALVEIWQYVLDINKIGINDNFFELGGDSIKAIRIISKAKKYGYFLEIKDLFKYPNIKELSENEKIRINDRVISQEVIVGESRLAPIQEWFFKQDFKEMNHWNQSIILFRKEGFDNKAIKKVFVKIVEHHDALRMVFKNQEYNIIQYNRGIETELFDLEMFDYTQEKYSMDDINKKCNDIQGSISLENGPLIKLGIFKTLEGDHLLIVIHHLVIDGISWRVLIEDFKIGYNQLINNEKIDLQEKTDSYLTWVKYIDEYSKSETLLNQVDYWNNIESVAVNRLKKDNEIDENLNNIKNCKTLKTTLSKEYTELLINKTNKAYNTEINDILLTALGLAINEWSGHDKILINLESHGREKVIEKDIDISRTIGWFTAEFPIVLSIDSNKDLGYNLKNIKEMLRHVPDKGIGYNVLKYFGDNLVSKNVKPEMSFNYLGQVDEDTKNEMVTLSDLEMGNTRALSSQNIYALEINAAVINSKLYISFNYNMHQFNEETLTNLIKSYKNKLCLVIDHCINKNKVEFTPADYDDYNLTLEELEKIRGGYEVNSDLQIKKIYSLTPMQNGMLFNSIMDSESTAYFQQNIFDIEGYINPRLFEDVFNELIARYDILRTVFMYEQISKPKQIVLKERKAKICYEDISDLEREVKNQFVDKFIDNDKKNKFNVSKDLLIRISLLKLDNNAYKFIWSYHHILMDGWCLSILMNEFFEIYKSVKKNEKYNLPKVPVYGDYIQWLEKQDKKVAKEYWIKYLESYEVQASIPKKSFIDSNKKYSLKEEYFTITKEMMDKIKHITKTYNVTMNTIIEAVWALLLFRYNNTDDVVFGSVVSGRNAYIHDIEKMVGLFINTIPVRITNNKDYNFLEFIEQIQNNAVTSLKYDYVSLAEIQANTVLKHELISNIVVFENFYAENSDKYTNEETDFCIKNFTSFEQTNYDFNLVILPGNEMKVKFEYNSEVYDYEFVKSVKKHFINVIEKVVKNPDIKVTKIDIMTEEEQEKVLINFNDTELIYKDDITIQELFENQVSRTPDNIAVIFGERLITYSELNEKSNSLARRLREKGVQPESIVGLMVSRSIEMIIGVIAIIKSGGAYLPIESTYPEDRISYMLEDSNAKILITEPQFAGKISEQCDILNIYDDNNYNLDTSNLDIVNTINHLIYVIYTSGTTGKPKGVMIEHKNLVNAANTWRVHYELEETEVKLLQMASISFDVFSGDLCRSLLTGGTMHVCSNDTKFDMKSLYDLCNKHKINILESTPNFLIMFMKYIHEHNLKMDYLKLLILGSDSCPIEEYKNLIKTYGDKIRILNSYGVTEATIDSSYYEGHFENIPKVVNTPIGKPLHNTQFYILSNNRQIQPIGVIGELFIGGKGVGRGYLNNLKLTETKFVNNPFAIGEKMYKTGDLARWLPDGNVEFLGRKDHQVKIRGFRIETSEIEIELLKYKDIKETIVVDKTDMNGNRYLCAYVVPSNALYVSEIRNYLKQTLPEYMVPSYFIQIDKLPLNANGKVDRKMLPELSEGVETSSEYEAPRDEVEKALVEIWQHVLDINKIGINDDFFDLGGDSIKAIQLMARSKSNGYSFEMKDLFQNPTIKQLSKYVVCYKSNDSQNIVDGEVELTPIQKWFFDMDFKNRHFWNQSVLLHKKDGINVEIVKKIFDKIINHHDALRIIYDVKNEKVQQINRGINGELYDIKVYDFQNYDIDVNQEITKLCTEIQSSINLETGPLVKLGVFKTNNGDHLLIVIHHLVVDGISWRILLEDFIASYNMAENGENIELPLKTTSFKKWSEKIKEYSKSSKIREEINYWKHVEGSSIKKLPKDNKVEKRIVGNMKQQTILLSEMETEYLLKQVSKAYNTEINDILLAALGLTISNWTGEENTLIILETHGREQISSDVDISRTIGWFTAEYPVIIRKNKKDELGTLIKNVKETIRAIPNKGVGYGILRYLTNEETESKIKFELSPEITFNYLGQFDENIKKDAFIVSNIDSGQSRSEQSQNLYALDFECLVTEKRLNISLLYDFNEYNEQTIKYLLKNYKNNLIDIIQHCKDKGEVEITKSDITDKNIELNDLNEYLRELDLE